MIPFINLANPLPTTPGTGLTEGQEAAIATATRRQPVASIAALKALTPSAGDAVNVLGYYAAGDGGGGTFYYDGESSSDDNGGTVIAPTEGDGRWLRAYSGAVNVRWFGAKGDNTANDAAAIQTALDTSSEVVFPPGTYKVTSTLDLTADNVKLIGSGGVMSYVPSWPLAADTTDLFDTPTEVQTIMITGMAVDGTAAGWHNDDPRGAVAFRLRAASITFVGNSIENFYGTGVRVCAGTVEISGNRFVKCAGYNLNLDDGGFQDNYGDAICLFQNTADVTAGSRINGHISGNYIVTDPTNNKGRCGISLDGGTTDSIVESVNVVGNYVSGYDRGVHVEKADFSVVFGNYVRQAYAPVFLTESSDVSIRDNILIADSPTSSGAYQDGVYLYGNNANPRCTIEGNSIQGLTLPAATIQYSDDIIINGNTFIGDVSLEGSHLSKGVRIERNRFNRRADLSDVGKLLISGNKYTQGTLVAGNSFYGVFVDANNAAGLTIAGNLFSFADVDAYQCKVINCRRVSLTDNRFIAGASATKQPIESYGTDGVGECSGNVLECDAAITLFRYNTTASHQGYVVNRTNYRITSIGDRIPLTFSASVGDAGNAGPAVYGASGSIPSGYYVKGTIVYNTSVIAGGTASQICTTAGYSAPAWAAATSYKHGNYVTNDTGKVYVCTTAGTSAGSGGPTGTGTAITDNTITWGYVAASAAAAFKTLTTASA